MIFTTNEVDKIINIISYPLWLLYIPFINIPIFLCSKHPKIEFLGSLSAMLISCFMSYPLYIINLSYLFETYEITGFNNISIYNKLQLLFTLFTLCIASTYSFLKLETKFFMIDGIALTLKDRLKLYVIIILTGIPALLIEIIHFFPILFAYYVDHSISYDNFLYLLLIFNAPKLIFVSHMLRKFLSNEAWKDNGICIKIILSIVLMIIFMSLPMIPYFIMMLFKVKYKRKQDHENSSKTIFFNGICSTTSRYYWNVVLYLWISHGGCIIYMIYIIGINVISNALLGVLTTVLFLCIFITISIPRLFYDFHRYFGGA